MAKLKNYDKFLEIYQDLKKLDNMKDIIKNIDYRFFERLETIYNTLSEAYVLDLGLNYEKDTKVKAELETLLNELLKPNYDVKYLMTEDELIAEREKIYNELAELQGIIEFNKEKHYLDEEVENDLDVSIPFIKEYKDSLQKYKFLENRLNTINESLANTKVK